MEALILVLAWPLIVFFIGFVVIAFMGVTAVTGEIFRLSSFPLIIGLLIFFAFVRARNAKDHEKLTPMMESQMMQSFVLSTAIGLVLPLFVHELLQAAHRDLFAMIVTLLLGFGFMVWGMFLKGNSTLQRANLIGGVLTVLYGYSQLWTLGEAARIIAAAIGFIAATAIAIAKFKDKLMK